jgi:hypothetical protein
VSSPVASRKRSLWGTSSSSFATRRIRDAEAQCLNELVDDVNTAEHIGPLFHAHIVEQRSTLFALRPRVVRVGEEKSLGAVARFASQPVFEKMNQDRAREIISNLKTMLES